MMAVMMMMVMGILWVIGGMVGSARVGGRMSPWWMTARRRGMAVVRLWRRCHLFLRVVVLAVVRVVELVQEGAGGGCCRRTAGNRLARKELRPELGLGLGFRVVMSRAV
ncbi:leucine-rich repeat extensin-like protein 4 [Iris pallida]|uniref:Leucine-rich repeat extensin-like protein 4 n=1 Tax=Iris pallida TaxID=29817 RepID=A0AAX6DQ12_IRIPA|nr:leucine-rich repeat extensin-like protein 4 [Iris pallida]